MLRRVLKERPCKMCGVIFKPDKGLQRACSYQCALTYARKQAWDAETKRRREKGKTLTEWADDAQEAFNRYVRLRDADLPCVSCGRFHTGQYHAGHYRPRSVASQLRFNLWNVHKQCQPCNTHLSANLALYRKCLLTKIGEEKVMWLEGNQQRADYSVDYLKRLKKVFNKKANRLQKRPNYGIFLR